MIKCMSIFAAIVASLILLFGYSSKDYDVIVIKCSYFNDKKPIARLLIEDTNNYFRTMDVKMAYINDNYTNSTYSMKYSKNLCTFVPIGISIELRTAFLNWLH